MNRKAWKLICIKPCFFGGVYYKIGDIKVFYSLIKSKQFIKKAPVDCFMIHEQKSES